ncbi:MAG: hypothetical protein ACP5US_06425 [Candidatus Kryptoniota bacterium]
MKRLVLLMGLVAAASFIAVFMRMSHKSDSNIVQYDEQNPEDYLGV